jgi:glycosyltransferase involved in cell wall biosynthesis
MGDPSELHVLRLCSVFEAPEASLGASGFDPIGGMQIHTAQLTRGLDALGIRQTVVTAFRPRAPRVEAVGDRSTLLRVGFPVKRFRQVYAAAAVPAIAARRFALVHAHVGEDLAIAPLARWAATRARVPLVVTMHCSMRHTLVPHGARGALLHTVGATLEDGLLGAADEILVLTETTADALTAHGIARTRIHVCPLGVDLGRFGAPTERPRAMEPGRRWIVYVGRLVADKGIRDLLEAVRRLRTPSASLLMVGDGPEHRAARHLARRLRIADRVAFTGPVAHQDVPPFLQHADVVVLPSWYEERGRIILEAMAAQAPVVATRTGGIPATIDDGVNGVLAPPHDPVGLAEALDRVLGDRSRASAMATRGRTTAAANGLDGLIAATVTAYDSALGHDIVATSLDGLS